MEKKYIVKNILFNSQVLYDRLQNGFCKMPAGCKNIIGRFTRKCTCCINPLRTELHLTLIQLAKPFPLVTYIRFGNVIMQTCIVDIIIFVLIGIWKTWELFVLLYKNTNHSKFVSKELFNDRKIRVEEDGRRQRVLYGITNVIPETS